MWQAIAWINDDPIHWNIFVSSSLNTFAKCSINICFNHEERSVSMLSVIIYPDIAELRLLVCAFHNLSLNRLYYSKTPFFLTRPFPSSGPYSYLPRTFRQISPLSQLSTPLRCKLPGSSFGVYTVGDRTVALNIIARCSITQTPTGQWNIDNVAD